MMFVPVVLVAAAAYANLSFRSVGPTVAGGRVAAVAGTQQDDQLYYLGTAGGGVWQSINGGATWKPVFEKQSVSAIGAVAVDPTNENVVWAGTGEANPRNDVSYGDGLYKSTDGAKTWRRVGFGGCMEHLAHRDRSAESASTSSSAPSAIRSRIRPIAASTLRLTAGRVGASRST